MGHKEWVIADQAVFSGTSFLTTIVIARQLQAESFGVYSLWILGIYLGISAIGAWSIQPFQINFGKVDRQELYTSFIFWGHFAIVLVVAVVTGTVLHLLGFNEILPALSFCMGFLMHDLIRKILLVQNRVKAIFYLDAAASTMVIVALASLSLIGGFDIASVMLAFSIVYAIVFLAGVYLLRPLLIDVSTVRSLGGLHLSEGKWYFMTAVSQWWTGNLFVVASGIYLGTVALGALRLAQSLFGVLNVLLQTFENYVLPQTATKMSIHTAAGITYLKNITLKAAWIFIPMLLGIFLLAEPILTLAGGDQYSSFGFIVQGLCILYVLIYISQPIRCIIRSLSLNRIYFQGYLMTLGFALIFSHTLLSGYGLYGVLAGLSISQIILIIYWSTALKLKYNKSWKSFILS